MVDSQQMLPEFPGQQILYQSARQLSACEFLRLGFRDKRLTSSHGDDRDSLTNIHIQPSRARQTAAHPGLRYSSKGSQQYHPGTLQWRPGSTGVWL